MCTVRQWQCALDPGVSIISSNKESVDLAKKKQKKNKDLEEFFLVQIDINNFI